MRRRRLLAAIACAPIGAAAGCLASEPAGTEGGDDRDDSVDGTDGDGANSTENDSMEDDSTDDDSTDGEGGRDSDADGSADESTYERCDRTVVWYGELPADVAAEVDAALDEGVYETTEELYFEQAIDVDAVSLSKDDVYYAATIEADGDATRLRLEETTPRSSVVEELAVVNEVDDEPIDLTLTVEDGANVVLEETIEGLERGYEHERRFPVTDEYGEYTVAVEFGSTTETDTWRIDYVGLHGIAILDDDGLSVGPESVADLAECPW